MLASLVANTIVVSELGDCHSKIYASKLRNSANAVSTSLSVDLDVLLIVNKFSTARSTILILTSSFFTMRLSSRCFSVLRDVTNRGKLPRLASIYVSSVQFGEAC
jgi:hypothetical protein